MGKLIEFPPEKTERARAQLPMLPPDWWSRNYYRAKLLNNLERGPKGKMQPKLFLVKG